MNEPDIKRCTFCAHTILCFLRHVWAETTTQDKVGSFQSIDCPNDILPEKVYPTREGCREDLSFANIVIPDELPNITNLIYVIRNF